MTDHERRFRKSVHAREHAEVLHGLDSRAYDEAHERMIEARDDLRADRAQAELRDSAMFGFPEVVGTSHG